MKGVVDGEGRKKRVRWRRGEEVVTARKAGEISCAVVRRVRGSRWRRMDSRSSGVERTLATEGGWGGMGGLEGVVCLARLRRARARGSGLCVIFGCFVLLDGGDVDLEFEETLGSLCHSRIRYLSHVGDEGDAVPYPKLEARDEGMQARWLGSERPTDTTQIGNSSLASSQKVGCRQR